MIDNHADLEQEEITTSSEQEEIDADLEQEQKLFSDILLCIESGNNKLFQNLVVETLLLDSSWIDNIEQLFHSIELIVKAPKKFIKDNKVLVSVDRAKRVDSTSMRYLASHSSTVRSVDKFGNVEPLKVLTNEAEEDLAIYENRFVCALIVRLVSFIEHKYTAIKERIRTHDITQLNMDSHFSFGKAQIDCNINVNVKVPSRNVANMEENKRLLERLEVLRTRLTILRGTEFYKTLSKLKPITPPIMKTNIINNNVEYRNVYKLWLFISSYRLSGFSVEVSDKNLSFDQDYFEDLTKVVAQSVSAMIHNNYIRENIYKTIPFRKLAPKAYKVLSKINYTPTHKQEKTKPKDDLINQYYFDQIKSLLQKSTRTPRKNTFVEEENLEMSFKKFYRGLSRINNEMINELVINNSVITHTKKRSKLERAKDDYNQQKKRYKEYQLISKLKANDLSLTLKRDATQLIKLEKLKYLLAIEKAKSEKKRKPRTKSKSTSRAVLSVRNKSDAIIEKAKVEEGFLLEQEIARQLEIARQEEAHREQMRLKRLEQKLERTRIAIDIIKNKDKE